MVACNRLAQSVLACSNIRRHRCARPNLYPLLGRVPILLAGQRTPLDRPPKKWRRQRTPATPKEKPGHRMHAAGRSTSLLQAHRASRLSQAPWRSLFSRQALRPIVLEHQLTTFNRARYQLCNRQTGQRRLSGRGRVLSAAGRALSFAGGSVTGNGAFQSQARADCHGAARRADNSGVPGQRRCLDRGEVVGACLGPQR